MDLIVINKTNFMPKDSEIFVLLLFTICYNLGIPTHLKSTLTATAFMHGEIWFKSPPDS